MKKHFYAKTLSKKLKILFFSKNEIFGKSKKNRSGKGGRAVEFQRAVGDRVPASGQHLSSC